MSNIDEQVTVQAWCNHCFQEIRFAGWQFIDIERNPQLKANLLHRTLNISHCRNCGKQGLAEFPICYCDATSNYFRIVYPEDWSVETHTQKIQQFENHVRQWIGLTGRPDEFRSIFDATRLFGQEALVKEVAFEEGYHTGLVNVKMWSKLLFDVFFKIAESSRSETISVQVIKSYFEKIDLLFFKALLRLMDHHDRLGQDFAYNYYSTAHYELEGEWLHELVRRLCSLSMEEDPEAMRILLEGKLGGCQQAILDHIQIELEYIRFVDVDESLNLFDEAFEAAYCCLRGFPWTRTRLLAHKLLNISTNEEIQVMTLFRQVPNLLEPDEMQQFVQKYQEMIDQSLIDNFHAMTQKFRKAGRDQLAASMDIFTQKLIYTLRTGQKPDNDWNDLAYLLIEASTRDEQRKLVEANRHLLDKGFIIALLANVGQPQRRLVPLNSQRIVELCFVIAEVLDDRESIAICNLFYAGFLDASGQVQEAINLLNNAEQVLTQSPPSQWLFLTHFSLSEMYYKIDAFQQAYNHAQKAYDVSRQLPGVRNFQVASLACLADAERELGRLIEAKQHCLEGLELCNITDNPKTYGNLLDCIGSVEYDLYEFESARDHHLEAVRIHKQLGHVRDIAVDLCNLARVEMQLGHLDQSAAFCEESMRLAAKANDWGIHFDSMRSLAQVEIRRGNLRQAQALLREVTSHSEQLGASPGLIASLLYLAEAQSFAKQFDEADETVQLAQSVAKQLGIWENYVFSWTRSAISRGDTSKARACLEQLKAIETDNHRTLKRYEELMLCGMIEWRDKEWKRARDYFSSALEVNDETQTLNAQASIWYYLGSTQLQIGDINAALQCFLQARHHAHRASSVYIEVAALEELGMVYEVAARVGVESTKNLTEAIWNWEAAFQLIESAGHPVFTDDLDDQLGFINLNQSDYFIEKMVLGQCSLGQVYDAFTTVERGKSRIFLYSLGQSIDISWSQIPLDKRQAERHLIDQIDSLTKRLQQCSKEEREDLLKERKTVQASLATLWNSLVAESEEYVSFRRGEHITFKDACNLLLEKA